MKIGRDRALKEDRRLAGMHSGDGDEPFIHSSKFKSGGRGASLIKEFLMSWNSLEKRAAALHAVLPA